VPRGEHANKMLLHSWAKTSDAHERVAALEEKQRKEGVAVNLLTAAKGEAS